MTTFNTICHIEIPTTNMDRAIAFYGGLFGWNFRPFMPTMTAFGCGDEHLGGLMLVDDVPQGGTPMLWFRVKDLDAMVAKAEELGGSLHDPRSEVPGVGWSAAIQDLDGNRIGLVMFTEDAV